MNQSEQMISSNSEFGKKQNMKISQKEFGAKYRNKKECYNFLTVYAKVYIDKYENVTIA